MEETTKPSQNPKPERSWELGPLTPQEIESLRQDRKESHRHSMEAFKHMKCLCPQNLKRRGIV